MPLDEETEETHPSYVMVSFNRIQGSPGPLFGSPIENHHTFIALRVVRATLNHGLGRNWYHGEMRPIIEVNLTSAQFAELLTTMNVGSGVPGTMASFDGKVIPRPKSIELESTKVREAFREKMHKLTEKSKQDQKDIEELLAKKNLTQADRAEISRRMSMMVQEIRSNTPFMLEQFEEAAEKVVTAAKAEVDSFMTHAITVAGMKALNMVPGAEGEPPPKELPEGTREGSDR